MWGLLAQVVLNFASNNPNEKSGLGYDPNILYGLPSYQKKLLELQQGQQQNQFQNTFNYTPLILGGTALVLVLILNSSND